PGQEIADPPTKLTVERPGAPRLLSVASRTFGVAQIPTQRGRERVLAWMRRQGRKPVAVGIDPRRRPLDIGRAGLEGPEQLEGPTRLPGLGQDLRGGQTIAGLEQRRRPILRAGLGKLERPRGVLVATAT